MNEQVAMGMMGSGISPSISSKGNKKADNSSEIRRLQSTKQQYESQIKNIKNNKKIDPEKAKKQIEKLKKSIASIDNQIAQLKNAESGKKNEAAEKIEQSAQGKDVKQVEQLDKIENVKETENIKNSEISIPEENRFDTYISEKQEEDNTYSVEKENGEYKIKFNHAIEEYKDEKEDKKKVSEYIDTYA